MTGARLTRIMTGTSAQMTTWLLGVLLPDARTVLDTTWGMGKFWNGSAGVQVTGLDISPHGRPQVVGDFTRLPFRDDAFDVVIFDPPYLSDMSRKTASIMDERFGSYRSEREAKATVQAGAAEAWRVARLGVIVKVMDHNHGSRLVRMTRWVEDTIPTDLYDVAYLTSRAKVEDKKWSRRDPRQLSVRANATSWLVWRKSGPVHRRWCNSAQEAAS